MLPSQITRMNILITGANGFLGQHLTLYLSGKGYNITAVSRGNCRIPQKHTFQFYSVDLTNSRAVAQMIEAIRPTVIIHTAALSKPDECENNKELCIATNVLATEYLLDAFQSFTSHSSSGSKFIYISTDFIFGEDGPHSEEDIPSPLNFYGETKLMAEQLVMQSGLVFSIVRPVFIYGVVWQGLRLSFLHWVKNNLEQNKPIKVVSDQQRTPTFVTDICKGIEAIIEQKKDGVFHLAGKDLLSPYQMAVKVADFLNLDVTLVESVTSQTFRETVQRAKRSGLKIDKARRVLGYEPLSFEQGVKLSLKNDL